MFLWARPRRHAGRDVAAAGPAIASVRGRVLGARGARRTDGPRRRPRRAAPGIEQLPWRRLVNPFRPLEVLSRRPGRVHPPRLAPDPGRDRRRGARRPGAGRVRARRRDRRPNEPPGPARPGSGRGAGRDGAVDVRASRPQPRARPRLRRAEPRLLRRRRSGVRQRPRPRPAAPATSPTSWTTSG